MKKKSIDVEDREEKNEFNGSWDVSSLLVGFLF